eukprot:347150_1
MFPRNKKIKKWTNLDILCWIQSIDLSDAWTKTAVQAIKESECTGLDWYRAVFSKEDVKNFGIKNTMLANRIFKKYKEIKQKQIGSSSKAVSKVFNKNVHIAVPIKIYIGNWPFDTFITLYPGDTIAILKHKMLNGLKLPPPKYAYKEKYIQFAGLQPSTSQLRKGKDSDNAYNICYKYNLYDFSHSVHGRGREIIIRERVKEQYRIKNKPGDVTCPHLQTSNQCPVYDRLLKYKFTQTDLHHMETYVHTTLKPINCKYGTDCKAYQRLIKNGNRLDDRCHVQVFNHPPRRAQKHQKIPENFHSYIFSENWKKPKELSFDEKENDLNDPLLDLLINEVKNNKFGSDLICNDGSSILKIVDEKMKHPRHIALGLPLSKAEMLSLILYTGCECNYDLCKTQRGGDYDTWKIFDYCLSKAIKKLWE